MSQISTRGFTKLAYATSFHFLQILLASLQPPDFVFNNSAPDDTLSLPPAIQSKVTVFKKS